MNAVAVTALAGSRAASSGDMDLLSHCETELEGARMRARGISLAAAAG